MNQNNKVKKKTLKGFVEPTGTAELLIIDQET